jgi:hypothetical protein
MSIGFRLHDAPLAAPRLFLGLARKVHIRSGFRGIGGAVAGAADSTL